MNSERRGAGRDDGVAGELTDEEVESSGQAKSAMMTRSHNSARSATRRRGGQRSACDGRVARPSGVYALKRRGSPLTTMTVEAIKSIWAHDG